MRKHFSLLSFSVAVFCLLSMNSCWTSIWTVAPTDKKVVPVQTVYSTQVTTSAPKHTTTTTVYVTSYNEDISFYLDLNAVAAAFAEARSVKEFEQILNSSRYMINNLDLNRDGWIDYLRVIETHKGVYHTLLIQACLAPSVYQDVATLVAEHRANALYVEVIGDPYLYGYNYIVCPVFVKRPPMWDVYGRPTYSPWVSPYYYGSWPSYYTRPQTIYLSHYQAYVHTYMTNHHYCHHCDYPAHPSYSGYSQMTQSNSRHDYQKSNPEQSFENRVTQTINASNTGGVSVRNAGQLRNRVEAESKKNASATTTQTSSSSSSRSSNSSSSSNTSSTSGSSRNSGSTSATSTSSSTRSSGSSSSSSSTPRQAQTSVESRVNKSGTTRTTIKTTDDKGRTTTVKRESSSTTRTSGTSTRSTGSSTRSSQDKSRESSPRSGQRGR